MDTGIPRNRSKNSHAAVALVAASLLIPGCATFDLASWNDSEGPVPPQLSDSHSEPGRPWANWRTPQEDSAAPRLSRSSLEERSESRASEAVENTPARKTGIRMGMTLKEVRRLWGTPTDVEVAGDPYDGNFRWTYPSSTVRELASSRVVTFEAGRVAGWETVRPD